MHALCVIASPENLLKMFAEEIEAIDFTALKARKDYFVCGMIIEKDGILFTSDPMFDLAVAFSKYTQKIQEKMLSRQQTQMADSYWFEAGSNCNNIKQAVDVYKAKHSDDLSSLKDLLNEGFVKGSKLIKELGWLEGTFDYLQFFDRESFSLEFLTDGKDGHYIIKVDTSKGKGGPSGRGPKEGVGTYESKTDTWTGKLESYGKMMSQMPRYEEPPELPFPPKLPDTDIEKEKVPLTDLYMVFSYKNLDDRFELIIRTDVKLNETKLNQISDKYKELLQKKETAIITIGSEAEFNKWQKNGGKVKIIFTTKQNDKFDDYRTDSFVIVY